MYYLLNFKLNEGKGVHHSLFCTSDYEQRTATTGVVHHGSEDVKGRIERSFDLLIRILS